MPFDGTALSLKETTQVPIWPPQTLNKPQPKVTLRTIAEATELLTRTRYLLRSKKYWCQGFLHRECQTTFLRRQYDKFCMMGALCYADGNTKSIHAYAIVRDAIMRSLPQGFTGSRRSTTIARPAMVT